MAMIDKTTEADKTTKAARFRCCRPTLSEIHIATIPARAAPSSKHTAARAMQCTASPRRPIDVSVGPTGSSGESKRDTPPAEAVSPPTRQAPWPTGPARTKRRSKVGGRKYQMQIAERRLTDALRVSESCGHWVRCD